MNDRASGGIVDQRKVAIVRSESNRPPRLTPPLDRRATIVQARSRLQSELRSIALDVLGPFEPGDLSSDCATWVDAATDSAVTAVCDQSLWALLDALRESVAEAPVHVVRRLDVAAVRRDTGIA